MYNWTAGVFEYWFGCYDYRNEQSMESQGTGKGKRSKPKHDSALGGCVGSIGFPARVPTIVVVSSLSLATRLLLRYGVARLRKGLEGGFVLIASLPEGQCYVSDEGVICAVFGAIP
jgi:hypothetical protein